MLVLFDYIGYCVEYLCSLHVNIYYVYEGSTSAVTIIAPSSDFINLYLHNTTFKHHFSTAKAIDDAGRIEDNKMSPDEWYRYIGDVATGDRDPVTASRAQVKDEGEHQSASSSGGRVFSRLLLQGNVKTGTLFAFNQEKLRDLCPIVEIQPKTVGL